MSKTIKLTLMLLNILLIIINNSAHAALDKTKLVIAGDYWCPYNCKPNSDKPGFLVDIFRRAMRIYDVDVEYIMMPWSKALDELDKGNIDGIIGINNIKDKNLIASKLPLEYSVTKAFTKKDSEWVYDGPESLRGKRLGIIMDYTADDSINNYIGVNYTINPGEFVVEYGKNAVIESIANILDNKSDVYIEDERVVKYYLHTTGFGKDIRDAGAISSKPLPIYIAFVANIPNVQRYIQYFEKGLASLKATGEYDELRLRYNMDH